MPNTVITIARSYGSGGRMLGKLLSEKLDVPYYDRNLIYLASDKSGIDVRLLFEHDETIKNGIFERLNTFGAKNIPPESRSFSSQTELFNYQSGVIRELADRGDCVIIGRCAGHILRDTPHKLVRVFIWAPPEVCAKTVMDKFSIGESEAKRIINDINKHRREYFKHYTGSYWDSATNYDLSINSSELSPDEAVERIIKFSKII